jgi:WD40 repeat protein
MTLRGHLNEIWSLRFSPDDRYLLTSSKDGTVKLWDAQTKPPPDYWLLDPGEKALGFTPDGRGFDLDHRRRRHVAPLERSASDQVPAVRPSAST